MITMTGIIIFLVCFGVGMLIGALIYRKNAKKIEREAKEKVDAMKYELDRLSRMVSRHKRK